MPKIIYKYPIGFSKREIIKIPDGAELLCVQNQNEKPCIWAIVDTENPMVERAFSVYPTGRPMSDEDALWYIGTIQTDGGLFVFHIFEIVE